MTLFTKAHIEGQKKIHLDCPAYGKASLLFAPMVSELVNANEVTGLLDYGAGLGEVPKHLELNHQVNVQLYDPAIPEYESAPAPAEMVICLDVLDVVEAASVPSVLDDLQRLTQKMAFFAINTKEAGQQGELAEGREFQSVEWWLPQLMERFELHYFSRIDTGFVVVLRAFSGQSLQ
ncbi:MAG: hypothetical protein C9356_03710 [Oleiphilus sp.]|nr:MAG: hypothetical protein C9356_03710 [Oleiphilus sp.]